MSYCRWSSDGFWCDVYCYEHVDGGFMTHVAGNRRPRRVCDIDWSSAEALQASIEQQRKELDDRTNQPEPIGLAHDGKTFCDETLQGMLDRLASLRDMGYNVPAWVFDRIREEMAEEGQQT